MLLPIRLGICILVTFQSNEMHIAVKDIMTRVGHANFETTMGYTHNINRSQEKY